MLVAPGIVEAAASDLAGLGSTISEAQTAAAASTTAIAPAAADEVSAAIAAQFSAYSHEFQALGARAREFHAQLVRALTGAAEAYKATEAANAAAMATPAAKGDPLRALGKLITEAAKKIVPEAIGEAAKKLDDLTPKAPGLLDRINIPRPQSRLFPWEQKAIQARIAEAEQRAAANAQRAVKILNNGVKFLASDGTAVYTTDGKAWVTFIRPLADGALVPRLYDLPLDRARQFGETAQRYEENTNRFISNRLKLDVQTVRDLWGSEYHAFARGEGLAQSYFQKTGNKIYQIDVDAAGRIIRRVESEARIFARWQSMTIGPRAPWTLLR
ncbi:hypothetical protein A5641_12320 [Mycobacterium sp. 1554424.7]|nr:hypothetical protein A5641_12320 [Mycobacterium sp. 1554424.7]